MCSLLAFNIKISNCVIFLRNLLERYPIVSVVILLARVSFLISLEMIPLLIKTFFIEIVAKRLI